MKRIVFLVACTAIGYVAMRLLGMHDLGGASYQTLIWTLLVVGLYGSVYGTDRKEARRHWKLLVAACVVGVLLKAALIAGAIVLASGIVAYAILGVVVAQVDPLATAAFLRDAPVSARVKTILNAWASFDDPVTVILVTFFALFYGKSVTMAQAFGQLGWHFSLNLLFALGVFIAWRLTRHWRIAPYLVLVASIVLAIGAELPLGIAIVAFFLRPPIDALLDRLVQGAFIVATILMGAALVGGINVGLGVVLGVSAFTAHAIVALLLTRHLTGDDRKHLALAKQLGITAIILALAVRPELPAAVAIVAPAVVSANVLCTVFNWWLKATTTPRRSAD